MLALVQVTFSYASGPLAWSIIAFRCDPHPATWDTLLSLLVPRHACVWEGPRWTSTASTMQELAGVPLAGQGDQPLPAPLPGRRRLDRALAPRRGARPPSRLASLLLFNASLARMCHKLLALTLHFPSAHMAVLECSTKGGYYPCLLYLGATCHMTSASCNMMFMSVPSSVHLGWAGHLGF